MTNLRQSLQDADRGFLAIVAELWGLDDSTARTAQALAEAMLQPGAIEEMVEACPGVPGAHCTLFSGRAGACRWRR